MQRTISRLGFRLRAVAGIALLLTLGVVAPVTAQDRAEVATFHGDLARTGQQPGPNPEGEGTLLWRYQTGGAIRSSPVLLDGVVYFGSNDGSLYALEAETGEPIWSFATGGPVRSTPAVADGAVYTGSSDGYVYALNVQDGKLRWKFYAARGDIDPGTAPNDDLRRRTVTAPVTVAGDTVLIATNDFTLHAVDAATGIERWSTGGFGQTVTAPAVADGLVVIGSEFGLNAFDLETGLEIWNGNWLAEKTDPEEDDEFAITVTTDDDDETTATEQEEAEASEAEAETQDGIVTVAEFFSGVGGGVTWNVTASPAIVDGLVYAVGFAIEKQAIEGEALGRVGGIVLVLDAESGGVVGSWGFKAYDQVLTTPAVSDTMVFVGSDQGFLYAVLRDGREAWGVQTEHYIGSSASIVESTVYAGNAGGTLYSLEAESGQTNWSYATGGAIWSSPAVVGGIVYVGSDDGFLYAIGGS